ncbi:Phosphomannomutase dehydrogenase [Klebsiella quasipneumoniae]|nr:Phosphomannomutase dehydrogenase [Klebsiella quasipneumoniae]
MPTGATSAPWSALWEVSPKDEQGNVLSGDAWVHNSENCYINSDEKLVAAIGVENLVIVSTKDARAGDEPRAFPGREEGGRVPQAEPAQRVQAPPRDLPSLGAAATWWSRPRAFNVNRITVKPGGAFSMQMHHHRAEHWVILAGTGQVTVNGKQFLLTENQSTFIPIGAEHSLENPGRIPLEVLEIQSGSYLGEDDIIRIKDQYGPFANFFGTKRRMTQLTCFKAYDIRGELGEELNEDIAYRIGRAYGEFLKPGKIVVGGDVRLTSESLKLALARGLMDAGTDVLDIGLSGTEEIYFATFHLGVDGGIEVTASHNPMNYNGMKLVRENAKPISGDTGLRDIQRLAEENQFPPVDPARRGTLRQISVLKEYVDHLMGYVELANFTRPLKLVVNSGNGAAGHVIDEVEKRFAAAGAPVTFIKVHHQPDGHFPNGIPNPLLPECRQDTADAVRAHQADMGIAFDGDFDRCFLFDDEASFIEGYYIVGLLAEAFLQKQPGAKIIHDPRLTWNTVDIVTRSGGQPVMSKTGHAFIKERMRQEDAIYGGEMSAHHYFRDFAYCDSGMIPWLLVAELLCLKNSSLKSLVADRQAAFPASGEINRKLGNAAEAIARIRAQYEPAAAHIDTTDGISIEYPEWRFNLRTSNTEPVVRLNVESRADTALMNAKTEEILALLK